jgi:ribulose-5-phosphate 4-epimerase/fuculose-1-phosphate aldolase
VDSKFVPVIKYEGMTRIGSNVIGFDASKFTGTKYRMYYRFLGQNDSVIVKGHGDIVKQDL